jgi:hypothetical protein
VSNATDLIRSINGEEYSMEWTALDWTEHLEQARQPPALLEGIPRPNANGIPRPIVEFEQRSVRFLLATAMRLLPQSERARYLEEFHAELLDLPRNTRLSHALSLLRGVLVLRLRRGLRDKTADAPARSAKS